MALLTNRQLIIIVIAIMPESCTNPGADTSLISRIAKHDHTYVKNTPDHPTYISYTMTIAPQRGFKHMAIRF